jgi:dihydroorotase
MYDLLLKGGRVIDPSRGIDEPMDVAVEGDQIARMAREISSSEARDVLDVSGKIVAPGLVDVHTHVYHPGRNWNHPDVAGVRSGVTTIADAGGPGSADFEDFCEYILPKAQTTVYSFLSVFRDRSLGAPPSEEQMDVGGVVEIARNNPDLVKGVKVIVAPRTVQNLGLKHVEASKRAAREGGVRLMMHIGDIGPRGQTPTPSEVTAKALAMLDPGDLVTHVFTPLTGAALDEDGRLLSALIDAQDRGVFIDTSYGDFNFGWDRADTVLAQGLRPDTIATDIEIHAGDGMRKLSERGLLEYASYFLAMGFSVEDVVRMTTATPAAYLGIQDKAGSLQEGRTADISVLDVVEGRWLLADATGKSRVGTEAMVPVVTVKAGKVVDPGEPPHPWGWTPPAAVEVASAGDGA